tara:strand:- start:4556 stop:5443 length:888 start_codon:yes stop_codon:yes gene_type:complete
MLRPSHLVIASFIAASGCGSPEVGADATDPTSEPAANAGGESPTAAEATEPDEERPDNEFQLRASSDSSEAHGERPSQIEATETEAAIRLFVVTAEEVAIPGVVVKMTAPDGSTYFTEPTDSHGYAEVLVPADQRYDMEYLSLGRRNTTASVTVGPGPRRNTRLTLRYRRWRSPLAPAEESTEPGFQLDGVTFESGSATIVESSYPRLDRVVEYMVHKPYARIRISGHTDNVGNARRNQRLSEDRAKAVRQYLVTKGIAAERIEAVGHGDAQPLASNDTEEGRAQNRRIEAIEIE